MAVSRARPPGRWLRANIISSRAGHAGLASEYWFVAQAPSEACADEPGRVLAALREAWPAPRTHFVVASWQVGDATEYWVPPAARRRVARASDPTDAALRALAASGKPFSICRPGFGWETTLAHRFRFEGRLATPAELSLLHEHNGARPARRLSP